MGCGCGGGGNSKKTQIRSQPVNAAVCPKCKGKMVYKQVFNKTTKGYIKLWECSIQSCKYTLQAK